MKLELSQAAWAGALASATLLPLAASANLVVDGSFETPTASQPYQTFGVGALGTAWNVTAGSVDLIRSYWNPSEGNQSLDLSGNQNGTISQQINLAAGTYKLTFVESGNPAGPPALKQLFVSLGGPAQERDYNVVTVGNSLGNMKWALQTVYFTVQIGGLTDLVFRDGSAAATSPVNPVGPSDTTPWGVALDDIQLTAVPEASTVIAGTLLLLPFGASTLRILRRKQKV